MEGFGPESFGALNADDYDALHDPGTTDDAVAFIAGLAGRGRVLELAVGTGRVALPLLNRGIDISGVEVSSQMVEKLRAKPGGPDIPVTIGDMADVSVEGLFGHIFLIYNTFFNLTTQEAQVRCVKNAAARLEPGGTFLIETFVPDLSGIADGQRVRTNRLELDRVWIEAATHDPVTQRLDMQRIRITNDGVRLIPLVMRYAWPSEIDLMAKLAGLTLRERWGSWTREPFTGASRMHVSVYEKP